MSNLPMSLITRMLLSVSLYWSSIIISCLCQSATIILNIRKNHVNNRLWFLSLNCLYKENQLECESMDKIFRKIIDNNFSDLKGTIVDASIPVPQYLINEIIEAAL